MISNSTPGWLELHDLSFHHQAEAITPKGLFIEGQLEEGDNFIPTSGIKGQAFAEPPIENTTPGWVELNGLRFVSDVTAVAPKEPYVDGRRYEQERFFPDKPYRIVGGPEE